MYDSSYRPAFSQGIWNGLKTSFQKGSSLTRLIYFNIGIFLAIKIVFVIVVLSGYGNDFYNVLLEYLGMPADIYRFIDRPWTLFTYMFTQFGFLHLLFNLLWLYWFGSFFLDHFNHKELTGVYLTGGIAGALLYVAAYNLLPFLQPQVSYSWAIGSSASVMAIVFAVCTYLPQNRIYIFLLGPVKLIHLAVFTAIVDLLSIPSGNAGGHIAHLGGALFGCIYAVGVKKHCNGMEKIVSIVDKISKFFSPGKKVHVKYSKKTSQMNDREYNAYQKRKDERINEILDKISRSGYESLSREEKEILFKSNK